MLWLFGELQKICLQIVRNGCFIFHNLLRFKDFIALCFILIYAIIQWLAINSPGGQDDIISARAQDIIMVIIGHYFLPARKDKNK